MVNVLKFLVLFSNKMWIIKAGNHKMLVRITNREDPDQTAYSEQSDLGLCRLSRPLCRQLLFEILERLPYRDWAPIVLTEQLGQ